MTYPRQCGTHAVELGPGEYIEMRFDLRSPSTATIEYVVNGHCVGIRNFWKEQAAALIEDILKNEEGSQAQGFVDCFRQRRELLNDYPIEPAWLARQMLHGTRYVPPAETQTRQPTTP
jgi:hypothetical protein